MFEFSTWSQILSIFLALIAIIITIYLYRKTESRSINEFDRMRIQILRDYSKSLSEDVVKALLENQVSLVNRDMIKVSLYGKLISTNTLFIEPTDSELNNVVAQAISIIEEQRFITLDIKQKSLEILMQSYLSETKISGQISTVKPYSTNQQAKILDEAGTYAISLILSILVILWLISHALGIKSELVNLVTTPVIFFPYYVLISYKGKYLHRYWIAYIRIHTYLNICLFTIILLVGKMFDKADPLYSLFYLIVNFAFMSLPVIMITQFIYSAGQQWISRRKVI